MRNKMRLEIQKITEELKRAEKAQVSEGDLAIIEVMGYRNIIRKAEIALMTAAFRHSYAVNNKSYDESNDLADQLKKKEITVAEFIDAVKELEDRGPIAVY